MNFLSNSNRFPVIRFSMLADDAEKSDHSGFTQEKALNPLKKSLTATNAENAAKIIGFR